jgi:hypothetical protein
MFGVETQKPGQEILIKSFHKEDEDSSAQALEEGKGMNSTTIIEDEDPPMECTWRFCWAEFK